MMTPVQQVILRDAIDSGYVLFCPKGETDLRKQYPELATYPEFGDKIGTGDMFFIWLFRCTSSPVAHMKDKDKLNVCIDIAYKSEAIREERKVLWHGLKFSGPIKAAMERMRSFNAIARIRRLQATKLLMDNCMEIIAEGLPQDGKERGAYIERAAKAQKAMAEAARELEAGSFGVEENSNTVLQSIKGVLKDHRVS